MIIAAVIGLCIILAVCVLMRLCLEYPDKEVRYVRRGDAFAQVMGAREIQADCGQTAVTGAGKLSVLADGIGKENTGKICAQLVVREFMDAYAKYHRMSSPEYFMRQAFYHANRTVQRTIGDRRGGASAGVVFLDRQFLYYAVAGDVKVALAREKELIPISKGQTADVMAMKAYEQGKLSRQEALWSRSEKKLLNYVGKDGFAGAEYGEYPVRLREGDLVVLFSKGIYEEVGWGDLENFLTCPGYSPKEKAESIAAWAKKSRRAKRENGSIIILETLETDGTNL